MLLLLLVGFLSMLSFESLPFVVVMAVRFQCDNQSSPPPPLPPLLLLLLPLPLPLRLLLLLLLLLLRLTIFNSGRAWSLFVCSFSSSCHACCC